VDSPSIYSFGICTRFCLFVGNTNLSVDSSAMFEAARISGHAGYYPAQGNTAPITDITQNCYFNVLTL